MAVHTETRRNVGLQFIRGDPVFEKEKPYRLYKVTPPDGLPTTNISFDTYSQVQIRDARGREGSFDLDRDSFKFIHAPSKVVLDESPESLKALCRETIEVIRRETNAERIICYEVLKRHSRAKKTGLTQKHSLPINIVHIDHSRNGGLARTELHLTKEEALHYSTKEWRWRIINLWRPLSTVVKDAPLAILHPKSLDPADVIPVDQVGQHYCGETCYVRYNPQQSWYWLSNQTCDEATIFSCFDTQAPSPYFTSCPHASFEDPTALPDDPPRESVEFRCIVLNKIA